jgi:PKD repeat protein
MANFTNHFYNNLFFNCGGSTYNHIVTCSMGGGYGVGSDFCNNVFIGSTGIETWNPVAVNYNAWDGASYGKMYGIGNWSPAVSNFMATLSQYGFVNATNYPYDFHLTSASILRSNALNLTANPNASTTDMDGNARPSSGAWDIGPYQLGAYSSSSPGLPPAPGMKPSLSVHQIAPLTIQAFGTVSGMSGFCYDFGDGNSSTNSNPIHAYTNAKAYTVVLTATNGLGQVFRAQVGVTVTP